MLVYIAGGASLGMLGPLLFWPAPCWSVPVLAVIGILLGLLNNLFMVLELTCVFGAVLSSVIWRLGLGAFLFAKMGEQAVFFHPALILSVDLILALLLFLILFKDHEMTFDAMMYVFFPVVGALLVVYHGEGLALGYTGGFAQRLFSIYGAGYGGEYTFQVGLASWLGLSILAVGFQFAISKFVRCMDERSEGPKGTFAERLLNKGEVDKEPGFFSTLVAPEQQNGDRFHLLAQAIHDKDADLSHLEVHERRLVEVCREDETERDRLLFGGGLW